MPLEAHAPFDGASVALVSALEFRDSMSISLTDGDELAVDDRPLEVEVPLNGIEIRAITVQRRGDTRSGPERRRERGEGERFARRGRNASGGKPVVGRESLRLCRWEEV